MKKTQNSAGFIQIILALVVIALVGGGMYYFGTLKNKANIVIETPTTSPASSETSVKEETTNWKTYTNTKYGFQFKYPSNQFNKPINGEPICIKNDYYAKCVNQGYAFQVTKSCDQNTCEGSIYVEVYFNPDLEAYDNAIRIKDGANNSVADSYFAGVKAKERIYKNKDSIQYSNNQKFYLVHNGFGFIISSYGDTTSSQILSTFKFTK